MLVGGLISWLAGLVEVTGALSNKTATNDLDTSVERLRRTYAAILNW